MEGRDSMSNLVEIRDLTKRYTPYSVAVAHVNLDITSGKIIGLLGPNGSGKTTLIKMLTGLLVPTEGSIQICGQPVGVETKKRVAYLPDKSYLGEGGTVEDLLALFADFYDNFSLEKAQSMLRSLQIAPEAKLRTLSKGTKEKIQLILVMSREADLYILDEPIAGVDPAARDYILKTIISNYNEEATVLLSTHLIADIENILDEVILIKNGQIMMQSSVDTIREDQGKSIDSFFREVFAC